MRWLHRNKKRQLLVFIIGIIIVPNIIEVMFSQPLHLNFENLIWYKFVNTFVMLLVGIPVFWWLISILDNYMGEAENVAVERSNVNEVFRQKNEELHRLAYYDELTGLPNRYMLENDLEKKVATSLNIENDELIGVAIIGMDRFKRVNDTMGNRVGDALLIEIARRLQEVTPKSFKIYRYTGDEFALVGSLMKMPEYIKVKNIVESLFSEPFHVQGEELRVSVSAGITMFPEQGKDADTLLNQANQALSVAKREGGQLYRMFEPRLLECAVRKMRLENDLFKALDQDELELYYQPQIDMKSERVVGAEALIRWNHPEFGRVSPTEFIPIAEETGAIVPIGTWVMRTACKRLKYWHSMGYNMPVAVNVSIRQLRQSNFASVVKQILDETKLEPKYLEIEITETLMQDVEETTLIFSKLKKLGVLIAVDDFGTGYASLSVLGSLPIDYLKIDQAFIREMTVNPKMYSIVKTIIQLGNNLEVELIAEGIENIVQQNILQKLNCEFGQGYLYSKPVSHATFLGILEKQYIDVS